MTTRDSFMIYSSAAFLFSLTVGRLVWAGDPKQARLESLRVSDAARKPAYTLEVTLEEPANVMLRDQGNSVTTCRITQGPTGFAASCNADKLPDAVFRPLGQFNYQPMDYDPGGNLGVAMRAKWVSLRTKVTNESYEEQKSVLVNPQGVVVDSGVIRMLHRYSPEDAGGWSLSSLRRVWWALGHGLTSDLLEPEGEVSELGSLDQMRIRGTCDSFPGGAWQMALEKQPGHLVRGATFIRDVDRRPVVEVATRGARQFDGVTFAGEGSIRFPINDRGDAIETLVILKEFQARFDEDLFRKVTEALDDLAGEEIQVVDYRADPKKPLRSTVRLPEGYLKDE